jgi:cell fate regulator YaaT (PSP1 superfamily)
MARVASVRLPFDPRTRWFDPKDVDLHAGDGLIVRTTRGLEYGEAVGEIAEVDDLQVQYLRSPLQPVVRVATDEDRQQRDKMKQLSEEALPVFKRLAAETNEDMHPIMVQYLFDGNRAVFLFEAEERTDFRALVRRLSSELHVHVDMRQIGVRDEARIVGGIGHCGQELCCARMGGEICPVSIKMAKAQDLSLNPQQISGVCGRLMCCLRYEYDAYKEFKSRAPKNNATIHTPEGDFKVCQLDMMHEIVVLRTDENKRVRIPLSAFDQPDPDAESKRPRSIGEAYYEYANASEHTGHAAMMVGSTERFTGTDKLAEKHEIHHNPSREERERHRRGSEAGHPASRRRRRSNRSGQDAHDGRRRSGNGRGSSGSHDSRGSRNRSQESDTRRTTRSSSHRRSRNRNHNVTEEQRARRSTVIGANGHDAGAGNGAGSDTATSGRAHQNGAGNRRRNDTRPSSTREGNRTGDERSERKAHNGSDRAGKGASSGGAHASHRRSRRRTHKTGNGPQGGSGSQSNTGNPPTSSAQGKSGEQ